MSEPCIAAEQITLMRIEIGKLGEKQDNTNLLITSTFARFQEVLDRHEIRISTLENTTKALEQIEGLRAKIEGLEGQIVALKSSESIRSWWDNKKDLIVPGLIIAGITYLAGILTVRGL